MWFRVDDEVPVFFNPECIQRLARELQQPAQVEYLRGIQVVDALHVLARRQAQVIIAYRATRAEQNPMIAHDDGTCSRFVM